MSISSVASNVQNISAVQPQRQSARANEVEGDKDKDDSASKVVAQAAPRPSVNVSGQTVGSIVDTFA